MITTVTLPNSYRWGQDRDRIRRQVMSEPTIEPLADASAAADVSRAGAGVAAPGVAPDVAPDVAPADRRLLRRQMLAHDVDQAVKKVLMDHGMRPGARISIDGLAREFQVSSTPVREALARLGSEGVAGKGPPKGYRRAPAWA